MLYGPAVFEGEGARGRRVIVLIVVAAHETQYETVPTESD